MPKATEPVENTFHRQIWAAANDWMICERAIAEARELAYAVLNPEAKSETLRAIAENWLEGFGRNSLRETRMAQQAHGAIRSGDHDS